LAPSSSLLTNVARSVKTYSKPSNLASSGRIELTAVDSIAIKRSGLASIGIRLNTRISE